MRGTQADLGQRWNVNVPAGTGTGRGGLGQTLGGYSRRWGGVRAGRGLVALASLGRANGRSGLEPGREVSAPCAPLPCRAGASRLERQAAAAWEAAGPDGAGMGTDLEQGVLYEARPFTEQLDIILLSHAFGQGFPVVGGRGVVFLPAGGGRCRFRRRPFVV